LTGNLLNEIRSGCFQPEELSENHIFSPGNSETDCRPHCERIHHKMYIPIDPKLILATFDKPITLTDFFRFFQNRISKNRPRKS